MRFEATAKGEAPSLRKWGLTAKVLFFMKFTISWKIWVLKIKWEISLF